MIQSEGGLILEGYHNIGTESEPRYIHLGFNGSSFVGVDADGVIIHIYEMDNLPTYDYTVRSADENWGTVTVSDGTQQDVMEDGEVVAHYYAATSDANKMNNGIITATPNDHKNNELSQGQEGYGQNKWLFDHWEQDGLPLDRAQYPAMINSNTLPIPFNGSNLVAYFRQNPYYIVPDGEKEPTSIDDMSQWLTELQNRDIPLETASTKKSAEVYDYTNRIYRVDLSTKANFQTFGGSIDMAFCMDVSASMKFPSKLVEAETNYNNNTNPIPIYKINNSGYGWSNKSWLDTNRTYSNPYYLIADEAGTATVFKIYYEGGNWRAQDASRNQGEKTFRIGDDFETAWTKDTQAYKDGNKNHPFNAGDNDNTTYIIYNNGDSGHDRFYYLQESFRGGSGELNTIAELLKVAGAASPNVRIAYNSFNGDLATGDDYWEDFAPASAIDVAFRSASNGGTRPDKAFEDLEDTSKYHWSADVGNRYVVLITDGAPQSGGLPKITEATNAATHIKEQLGVKIITVGLSMDDVTEGKKLLYDIADKDKNGDKMFYLAESGDDLQGIIRKITKTIMEDVVVIGDITDTVGEAFYLVDKETGMPLGQGDMIDIEGNCTTDENQAAGIVQEDGKTVKWLNQSIDHTNGWHGVVYVKAQEELLGGNAVNTNAGAATVVATKYRTGGEDVYFDTTSVKEHLKLSTSLPSPKVNVNELTFFNNETDWTVYLGEKVDPKQQLKALYDSLVVEEVVNEDESLHYSLGRNTIEERWDTAVGTAATFPLPDLIENLIHKDSTLEARYLDHGELDWDVFLTDILDGGIILPYHEFGLTDGSNIKITLEKTIVANEEDDLINESPHDTTVTGEEVEKYVLRIAYEPDYTVTPIGQGGQSTEIFHTGTFGTMYQGHAAGREASTNTHIINVYNIPLDVYKTDGNNQPLSGATFKLYKEDNENGEDVPELDGSHKYVEVAAGTSGTDGIARLKHGGEDFGLALGETYYLIETEAPVNYTKVNTVWEVEVQTEIGKFTNLDDEVIYSLLTPDTESEPPIVIDNGVTVDMYPFNWDQGARIMLDGRFPVPVIAKGATEESTIQITNGSFVSHEKAISFRHTVLNLIGGKVNIGVEKTWERDDEQNRPVSVTVKLYRVSEKDHVWGEGVIVPSTCTAEGNKTYTCLVCGATKTETISEAGHMPGTPHRENETVATCTKAGGYDTVVRCTVCNAIVSSEHTATAALGHTPGETVQENYVAPTYTAPGGYDEVVYCTRCGEEISRTHVTLPKLVNPNHTVTITFKYIAYGNIWSTSQETITSRTGTGAGDMTIQWNWNSRTNPQYLDLRVEGLGTSRYTTSSSGNYNGAQQTLTISNISEDLNVTVIIDNWGYAGTSNNLIGQPSFAGLSRTLQASAPSLRSTASLRSAAEDTIGPLRANISGLDSGSMTQTELTTAFLDTLAETATCEEGENHTYKEVAGTYEIKASEDWTLNIPDLPQYNEYGKPYTYYVVETPVEGYETTYSGQENGLTAGTVTITNTKKAGSLKITKAVTVNDAATDTSSLTNGTYTFSISGVTGTPTAGITHTVSITFANGRATGYAIDDGSVQTVSGTDNTWSVVVPDLVPGSYTVSETDSGNLVLKSVAGGSSVTDYVTTITVTDGDTTAATAAAQVVFTNNIETVTISGSKIWVDSGRTHNNAQEITLTLKRTVKPVTEESVWETVPVSGEVAFAWNGNNYTYSNLLRYQNANNTSTEYEYKVEETSVHVTEVEGGNAQTIEYISSADSNNFTNTEVTTIEATKTWKDKENPINGTITNASVTFELQRKNSDNSWTAVTQTADLTNPVIMSVEDTANAEVWKAEWSNLPKFELVEGTPTEIEYRVAETAVTFAGNSLTTGDPVNVTAGTANIDNYLPVDLTILKVDSNGMTKALKGATFTIQQIDETASVLSLISGTLATAETNGEIPGETGDDGVATFTGLSAGYYIVKETKLPAGYIQTDTGSFYIRVKYGEVKLVERDGTGWKESDGNEKLIFTAANGSNPASVKVGNEPGAALPNTGGPGTKLLYLLGILLTGLAGAGLMMKKWRRAE